nr:MAG TPA: hypothetical protein [Caudoviricetes sp.]
MPFYIESSLFSFRVVSIHFCALRFNSAQIARKTSGQ